MPKPNNELQPLVDWMERSVYDDDPEDFTDIYDGRMNLDLEED
jgi:hypothetical protein